MSAVGADRSQVAGCSMACNDFITTAYMRNILYMGVSSML
jgi:hypothetical protein